MKNTVNDEIAVLENHVKNYPHSSSSILARAQILKLKKERASKIGIKK